MAKAKIVKQLLVTTPNEVGTLNKISTTLVQAGLNLKHLCASTFGEQAVFMVILDNHEKAKELLENFEYEVILKDALEVEFKNQPGTLSLVAQKLADADIDVKYIYGTSSDGETVIGVFSTNDNKKAVNLINLE